MLPVDRGAEVGVPIVAIALAIFGAATAYAIYETARLWLDERRVGVLVARMKNGIGRGDEALSRAHVRALPVICFIGASTVLDGFVLNHLTESDGGLPGVMGWLVALSIPVNGLMLALWAIIVYFNRPKFIVPPHMRNDHGLRAVRKEENAYRE